MKAETLKMFAALEAVGFQIRKHKEEMRRENIELLRQHFSDEVITSFFAEVSFDTVIEIGNVWFDQVNCFQKEFRWEEQFIRCLKTGLLPVGSGLNGDPIVLDAQDCIVGFLFHDKLWEADDLSPRDCLVKMDCSIGQFFLNAATIEEYPVDAYEAHAFMGLGEM